MGKPKLRGEGITQLATLYAKVHRAELAQGFLEHLPLDAAVWEETAPCNKDFHGEKKTHEDFNGFICMAWLPARLDRSSYSTGETDS